MKDLIEEQKEKVKYQRANNNQALFKTYNGIPSADLLNDDKFINGLV